MPPEYPLPSKHPLSSQQHPSQRSLPPKDGGEDSIRVIGATTSLLSRATDLYLSAASVHGELRFIVLSDRNVYSDELVSEWLDEIKAAAEWYLGGGISEPLTAKL